MPTITFVSGSFLGCCRDLVEVPEKLDSFDVETRELLASEIMKSVCPTSEYFDIYCDLLNTLKEGFISRNPLDSNTEKWKNNTVRKMIKRKWYQKNKKISIERAKKWNTKHAEARRLIIARHLHKKSWKTVGRKI